MRARIRVYPSKEELLYFFDYDVETGDLIWKNPLGTKIKKGSIAGSFDSNGYLQVRLKKALYQCHRFIWIMHNGDIPEGMEIDHKDNKRSNNKLYNLRLATKSQNRANS